jgi:preprotein translocase subunit SecB
MSSALLLERHFFSRLELKPNAGAKPDGIYRVSCNLAIGQAADQPRRFQVTLTVSIDQNPASKSPPYYSGVIEIVGFFRVADEYPDDPARLVHVSGSALLYGAVRELMCNLTARGPWPMVTLPTMNFTPEPASGSESTAPIAEPTESP